MPHVTDKSIHSFAKKIKSLCKVFAKRHNLMQVKIKFNYVKGVSSKYDIITQVKCIFKGCNCKTLPYNMFCGRHDKMHGG